jgi:hypothetical protein
MTIGMRSLFLLLNTFTTAIYFLLTGTLSSEALFFYLYETEIPVLLKLTPETVSSKEKV